MKSRIFPYSALLLIAIASTSRSPAQTPSTPTGIEHTASADTDTEPLHAFSSSNAAATGAAFVTLPPSGIVKPETFHPFSQIGIASQTGFGGAGFDIATPLARKFNLRAGANFFSYATSFQEQGANVAINLHMMSGHTALDWFPFGGRFRMSPQLIFANNNRIQATALIPSGSTVTLNGQNYISSYTDPLHGSGLIDFRKASPGFTFGFGNILPRTRSRFSIPVEMGFYYVGQPGLKVNFTGSACDPTVPSNIGCESVDQDPGFQQNLTAFITRNNHNLSYASFFPILSIGFGYRLW